MRTGRKISKKGPARCLAYGQLPPTTSATMIHTNHEVTRLFVRFGLEGEFYCLDRAIEGEGGPPGLTFELVGSADPKPRGRIRVTNPAIGTRLWKAYQKSEPVGVALEVDGSPYLVEKCW